MRVISLTLDSIRHSYIRQEGSIIFSLLERTRCCFNPNTYDFNILSVDDSSLVESMLRETEKLHAQVGQYKNPDEHPFFPADLPDGPDPILPPLQCQQSLSKTIHYAKFVAEAKLRASPDVYAAAIEAQVSAIHQFIEANVKDKPNDGSFSSSPLKQM